MCVCVYNSVRRVTGKSSMQFPEKSEQNTLSSRERINNLIKVNRAERAQTQKNTH